MQCTTSRPETDRRSTNSSTADPVPASTAPADLALFVAIVGPVAMIGLLVLIGVGFAVAVFITFVSVFAVTTTLDVVWFLRRRRLAGDRSRFQS